MPSASNNNPVQPHGGCSGNANADNTMADGAGAGGGQEGATRPPRQRRPAEESSGTQLLQEQAVTPEVVPVIPVPSSGDEITRFLLERIARSDERMRILEQELRGHAMMPRGATAEVEAIARRFKAQMLTSADEVPAWLDAMEVRLRTQNPPIPEIFWSGVALRYVGDSLIRRLRSQLHLVNNWPGLRQELLKLATQVHPIPDAFDKVFKALEAKETLAARRSEMEQTLRRWAETCMGTTPLTEQTEKLLKLLAASLLFRWLPANVPNAHYAFKAEDPLEELVVVAGETLPRGALADRQEETRERETLATGCFVCGDEGHFARECPRKAVPSGKEREVPHDVSQVCKRLGNQPEAAGAVETEVDHVAEEGPVEEGVPLLGGSPSPDWQALASQRSLHRKTELLRVALVVNDKQCVAIIDTASNSNLIRDEWANKVKAVRKPVVMKLLGTVPGSAARTHEVCTVQVRTESGESLGDPQECVVLDTSVVQHILLGNDFLMATKARIDYLTETVTFRTRKGKDVVLPFEPMTQTYELLVGNADLVARGTEVIPPWTQRVLTVEATGVLEHVSGEVWVEPNRHGKLVAAHGIAELKGGMTKVLVANFSHQPLSVRAGNPVALTSVLTERQVVVLASKEVGPQTPGQEEPVGLPDDLDLSEAKRDLTRKQMRQLIAVLRKAKKVFRRPGEKLGATNVEPFSIETTSEVPIHMAPRRLPPHKMAAAEKEVKRMDDAGVTSPAKSAWSFPVVLSPKPSGDLRFCVDFRKLNDITVPDNYPLPRCDDLLKALAGAKYFTALDLECGFWQIPLEEGSKDKATFAYPGGARRYENMPFGLKNASAHFQRTMDAVLAGVKWQHCLVYIDDILIFSDTFENHLVALEEVFQKLMDHNFKVKPSKCNILRRVVKFLGHLVSRDGVRPNPEKILAIENLPVPKTESEVLSFLGLTSYFRKFVPNYARVARPLYQGVDEEKGLTQEQRDAFLILKTALVNPPTLAHPRPNDPFVLEADACEKGLGAVLLQKDESTGKLRPVEYASRLIRAHEMKWPIREKEALSIVWACGVFRLWLTQQEFVIRTDHESLRWLNKSGNARLERWALELMQYQYRLIPKKGHLNVAADFCSRSGMDTNPGLADSIEWPEYAVLASVGMSVDDMRRAQLADAQTAKMLGWLEHGTLPNGTMSRVKRFRAVAGEFAVANGLLMRQGRVVVPHAMRAVVLKEIHSGDLAAHLSAEKMMGALAPRFWWRSMWKDARAYASACVHCARATPFNSKRQGWLRPITAEGPWHTVAMDFKGPWESGIEGETYVLVIMDHFTKYVILVPLRSREGSGVAKAFLEQVICRFQCPVVVISDNAKEFTMGKFKDLCERYAIAHKPVLPYHQQANGMVERYMQMLNKMVKIVATEGATDWPRRLCSVAFAYNISYHPTINNTPYFLNHLRDPRLPVDNWLGREEVREGIDRRAALSRELMTWTAEMIERAQSEMKARYDQHQKDMVMKEGDMVLVRNEKLKAKREPLWSELHRVVAVSEDGLNVTVCPVGGTREEMVSVQRLRPYHPSQLNPWRLELAPVETEETVVPSPGVTGQDEVARGPERSQEYVEMEVIIPCDTGSSGERERKHSSWGPSEPAASGSDQPVANAGQEAPEGLPQGEDNLDRPLTPREVPPPEPAGMGDVEQASEGCPQVERMEPAIVEEPPEQGEHSAPIPAPGPGVETIPLTGSPGPLRVSPGGGRWFAVDEIVAHRLKRGYPQYKIHWRGYSSEEDTWEWEDNIPTQLLNDYRERAGLPAVEALPVEEESRAEPSRRRRARARGTDAPTNSSPKRRRRGQRPR
jgi:transposase InsO family protein